MKVIVAGSRSITDYDLVARAIRTSGLDITEIVSGTARGVDSLGERFAAENGIPVAHFPADWTGGGRGAGFVRNYKMAEYADALIAIWDGESRGTAHMIEAARKKGLSTIIVNCNMQ
jgi:hypothetical protein